jgi:glutaminyl-tRNA synthetase
MLFTDQMKEYRGTLTEPGKNSPFRERSIEENLRLFHDMKSGKFEDGQYILRAKIDMASPNLNMRDPTLYRIKREKHPITGNEWCIYPMYDFAHAISDAMEGITHSLCTLEFEAHRPLYDWTIDNLLPSGILPFRSEGWRPHQYEFSRLNVQHTVLSKRKLIQLVKEGYVNGWDDPRMPTIIGMRRRGYPAEALKLFCDRVGISKSESNIDFLALEDCVREILDNTAPRTMAVLHPLKVVITNWPENHTEMLTADVHPKFSEKGKRTFVFSKELFIDRNDFFDTGVDNDLKPPKGYKRFVPGGNVRLKFGFVINCNTVIRDDHGEVTELHCTYDAASKGGITPEGAKKAKGIIQWVSAHNAQPCQIRLYDRLFSHPSPGSSHEDGNFLRDINPNSFQTIDTALVEKSLMSAAVGTTFQFERVGYFAIDSDSGEADNRKSLVINRVVTLRDTWAAAGGKD